MDLTRATSKLFLARATGAGITFVGVAIFAREIGPAAIGAFFLFETLLAISSVVADVGIREAVEKRMSERDGDDAVVFSTGGALKLVPLALISGAILLLGDRVDHYVGAPVAHYLVAGLVLQEAGRLLVHRIRGNLRVGTAATFTVVRRAVWFAAGAAFVAAGFDGIGLIYALLLGLGAVVVTAAARGSVSVTRPTIEQARSLLAFAKYNVVSRIGMEVYGWVDLLVIGLVLTQRHVGIYQVAWQVTVVVSLFSVSIASAAFPQVSSWNANRARDRIESVFPTAVALVALVAVPAFVGSVLLSREILGVVFGPEYVGAWLVLIVLMGEKAIQALGYLTMNFLDAIDRPNLTARSMSLAAALNIILNVVLILEFGIIGAAIAAVVAFGVGVTVQTYYLSQFIRVRVRSRWVGWCVIASGVMALAVAIVKSIVPIDGFPSLIGVLVLASTVYGAVLVLFAPIRTWVLGRLYELATRPDA